MAPVLSTCSCQASAPADPDRDAVLSGLILKADTWSNIRAELIDLDHRSSPSKVILSRAAWSTSFRLVASSKVLSGATTRRLIMG